MITKKCAVSLAANALFMLISFVALYLCELLSFYKYSGLILAIVLTVVAICLPTTLKSQKVLGILIFVLNALAFGCAVCFVFLCLETFPKLWTAAACLGGYTLIFYLFCLVANAKIVKIIPALWIVLLILVLAVAGTVGMVLLPETGFFQLATFSLKNFTFYISTTAYGARDLKNHLFHTAVASSILAIIAAIIALVVVTEGEVLDAADTTVILPDGEKESSRRRNPFEY